MSIDVLAVMRNPRHDCFSIREATKAVSELIDAAKLASNMIAGTDAEYYAIDKSAKIGLRAHLMEKLAACGAK